MGRDTDKPDWKADGAMRASSLNQVIDATAGKDLWVAGGGEIYALALPLSHECFVTEIDARFDGDTWAPDLPADWRRDDHHPASSDWQHSTASDTRLRYGVYVRHEM